MFRYLTADYIFPISSPPIKNGVVEVAGDGTILHVHDSSFLIRNPSFSVETHNGIICPGFINTHCHLELSYLKNSIPEHTGIAGFIKDLVPKRSTFTTEQKQDAIEKAELEMINNGIVAVGDISNDDSTFLQKAKGNLKYHTFFEVFDLNPNRADEVFGQAIKLEGRLKSQESRLTSSIVPHAPYSVSEKLFHLISDYAQKNNSIISYHNQESLAESELFENKSGAIIDLFSKMGINLDYISKTGKNSLHSTLPYFSKGNKTLLVHNTCTGKEDILFTIDYFKGHGTEGGSANSPQAPGQRKTVSHLTSHISHLFFCFCPNANLYIENKLPDFQSFIDAGAICTIGTDSLASNHSLSVLDELKMISKHAPQIKLQTLLTWASLNGATLLNFANELGSIEKGKRPGLNLISGVDLNSLQLTSNSIVKKLV